ncbi:MAG TPA: reverse transcriptase domain-containing protein [Candidatus Hydrogenedentes bacterium]|nr:reverse transcriptase domain-containing protein [Candidatus Hydrogenedentota bacterium]
MEDICREETFENALIAVEKKGGCPGVDGMRTSELREALNHKVESVFVRLLERKYFPKVVVEREIPKGDGKYRKLAIPTVTDRLVQRMLLIELTKVVDPTFSHGSFGFRPGRSQIDAIRLARIHFMEGFGFVVDIDITAFFDNIDRNTLMMQMGRYRIDDRIMTVINRFASAGRLIKGDIRIPRVGIPQGGPLSPFLANVYLDDLDRLLERHGCLFVRYADDIRIAVRTQEEGEEMMNLVASFLKNELGLDINISKSLVTKAEKSPFLGYTIDPRGNLRIAPKSLEKIRLKIKELLHKQPLSEECVKKINESIQGWMNYFRYAIFLEVEEMDEALEREIEMCPHVEISKQGIRTFQECAAIQGTVCVES